MDQDVSNLIADLKWLFKLDLKSLIKIKLQLICYNLSDCTAFIKNNYKVILLFNYKINLIVLLAKLTVISCLFKIDLAAHRSSKSHCMVHFGYKKVLSGVYKNCKKSFKTQVDVKVG